MTKRKTYRVERRSNLLWVKAAVGSDSVAPIVVRLLVDTGSSFTILPNSIVQDLNCDLSQPIRHQIITAAGGRMNLPVISLPWLNCLGQRTENFPVLVHTLPEGTRVDGLLGMNWLKQFRVIIDVSTAEISVCLD